MLNKSDSIAKLALALSKLQGEVTDAPKNKAAHNHKHADLAGVLEIARPLLLKYELAVSQLPTNTHEIDVGVTTILMHSSGEWISSTIGLPLSAVKNGNQAQGAGAITTYLRRYSLAAILGITQIDDDAESVLPVETVNWSEMLKEHCLRENVSAETAKAWCAKYGVERLSHLDKEHIKEIMGMK